VLRKACEQAHRWHLANPEQRLLTMSVNISGRQFKHPDIVEQVEKILRETQVDPAAIKLEMTETVTMDNVERTIRVVNGLKNLGVRLSIDDFGTGYSSLSYLRRFPMDTLKIDRSFTSRLPADHKSCTLVSTIIGLAHAFDMTTVAEGVESQAQFDYLLREGCDVSQGYLHSRPVPKSEFEAWLRTRRQPARGVVKHAGAKSRRRPDSR